MKAKAADQNDEELELLNENLEVICNLYKVIKKIVKRSSASSNVRLIIDSNIWKSGWKWKKFYLNKKEIREFHEINLKIAKNHPNMILDEI